LRIGTPINQDARLRGSQRPRLKGRQPEILSGLCLGAQGDLLRATHDSLIVRDGEGRIILWNRAAEELYGWAESEALGQLPETLLKTKLPKSPAEIQSQLRTDGRWEGEVVHTTRAGRTVLVASRWAPVFDGGGQRHGILQAERELGGEQRLERELCHVREKLQRITEQRLIELEGANEALVETQARFQHVAEAIQDLFWLTNPWRTSILYVNPAYERIWGRSCQSLYADPRSWLEGLHPEDRPRIRQLFLEPVPAQGSQHSYRVVRPDCSVRWVLDRSFPVREHAAGFRQVVGIVRDVTESRELEKEILAISEREQRRMGQDLHDDLCQQLAGIEFLSKALQQQLKEQPQAAKAGEIATLIRAAIEYTRQFAKGLAPIELEAEGLMRGLRALAARAGELFKVDCEFECPSNVLVQDPTTGTHLYRIAQEALTNSIKHGKATRIKIVLTARADGGELIINDNGNGLSNEAYVSGGMGLRIMRYRADMIGGSLAIRANGPAGASVVCTFPLTAW
jgi:PAS domain S-box-containing protein